MAASIKIRAGNWWRQLRLLHRGAPPRSSAVPAPKKISAPPPRRRRAVERTWFTQSPTGQAPDYVDLFEHAPVGYMLLDNSGFIETINHTGAEMLGWDASWLVGKPFSRWVVNNDKQLFRAHRYRLQRHQDGNSQELRIKNRQGRAVNVRLQSVREAQPDGSMAGCRSIMVDVSGEEKSARRLRRLQAELAHVTRLQTVSEMASSLAHELNQPLGTVVLNCEAALRMLNSGAGQEYEFAETLCQATEAASFASEVVRHLRGFLRKSEELHRVCKTATLIRDVTTLIEADARDRDIELALNIERDLPTVRVDAVQIEQVLVNLARNGIEAIGERDRGHPNRLTIGVHRYSHNQVCVTVADTGPGLNPQQMKRIFSPFYTTKPDGMGMGLAISRSIIEAHGGKLWATGTPGGATLHFTLPTIGRQKDAD